jgi:hypothetical protein
MKQKTLVLDKVNYAWCAGFFEGEGSTTLHSRNLKYKQVKPQRVQIAIAQVNKVPLLKFKRFTKEGEVNGPYGPYLSNKQKYYQYHAVGKSAVRVLRHMWPFLSPIKRMQASRCLGGK